MDISIRPVDCAFDVWIRHMSYTQFAHDHIGAGSDYHAYKHEAEVWGKQVMPQEQYENEVKFLNDEIDQDEWREAQAKEYAAYAS